MTQVFENARVLWKNKIKYMQILFLILILILYFVFSYVKGLYGDFNSKKAGLESAKIDYTQSTDELAKISTKKQLLNKIYSNSGAFIQAYNNCYVNYIQSKYSISGDKIIDLTTCINQKLKSNLKGYNGFIKKFLSDEDIKLIAIMFGIYQDKSKKMDFDEKKFLYSLDQNIFQDSLENKVNYLTVSKPVLIDAKRKFYKVDFTFQTMVSYSELQNLLKRMQDRIYTNDNFYYTISSISDYDITGNMSAQTVTIQASFYFTKK